MLILMVNLRNRALIELSEVKLKIPAEFLGKGGAVPSTPVIAAVLESTQLLSSMVPHSPVGETLQQEGPSSFY